MPAPFYNQFRQSDNSFAGRTKKGTQFKFTPTMDGSWRGLSGKVYTGDSMINWMMQNANVNARDTNIYPDAPWFTYEFKNSSDPLPFDALTANVLNSGTQTQSIKNSQSSSPQTQNPQLQTPQVQQKNPATSTTPQTPTPRRSNVSYTANPFGNDSQSITSFLNFANDYAAATGQTYNLGNYGTKDPTGHYNGVDGKWGRNTAGVYDLIGNQYAQFMNWSANNPGGTVQDWYDSINKTPIQVQGTALSALPDYNAIAQTNSDRLLKHFNNRLATSMWATDFNNAWRSGNFNMPSYTINGVGGLQMNLINGMQDMYGDGYRGKRFEKRLAEGKLKSKDFRRFGKYLGNQQAMANYRNLVGLQQDPRMTFTNTALQSNGLQKLNNADYGESTRILPAQSHGGGDYYDSNNKYLDVNDINNSSNIPDVENYYA